MREGHGTAVALVGEAGVGKTHLLRAFSDQLDGHAEPADILQFSCSSIFAQVDYFPFAAQVARSIGVTNVDGPEVRMAKLTAYSSRWHDRANAFAPALFHLLGLAQDVKPNALHWGETSHGTAMAEVLQAFVLDRTKSGPLIVAFEDVHWADTGTLDVVAKLIEIAEHHPIMMLLTSRTVPAVCAGKARSRAGT